MIFQKDNSFSATRKSYMEFNSLLDSYIYVVYENIKLSWTNLFENIFSSRDVFWNLKKSDILKNP